MAGCALLEGQRKGRTDFPKRLTNRAAVSEFSPAVTDSCANQPQQLCLTDTYCWHRSWRTGGDRTWLLLLGKIGINADVSVPGFVSLGFRTHLSTRSEFGLPLMCSPMGWGRCCLSWLFESFSAAAMGHPDKLIEEEMWKNEWGKYTTLLKK